MVRQNDPDTLSAVLARGAYDEIIQRAHALAERTLKGLEELHDLYPSDLPSEVIEAVRHFHACLPGAVPARATRERRRAPRFAAHHEKLILTDLQAPTQAWEVVAVDRSWGGCAFVSNRPLAAGAVVTVWDADAPEAGPPTRAEVKSCRPQGDAWAVGCELLPAPQREQEG
jgi:hypothetical protein